MKIVRHAEDQEKISVHLAKLITFQKLEEVANSWEHVLIHVEIRNHAKDQILISAHDVKKAADLEKEDVSVNRIED